MDKEEINKIIEEWYIEQEENSSYNYDDGQLYTLDGRIIYVEDIQNLKNRLKTVKSDKGEK